MGAAMARALFGVDKPSIGLLNIGVEEVKGLDGIREAAAVLKDAPLPIRYHGFVEGDDVGRGVVDVVVTDGFTGNIALKTAEGTAKQIGEYLRAAMGRSLRALRTPVPARPSGMMRVVGRSQLGLGVETEDEAAHVTAPRRRAATGEVYGNDEDEADSSMQAEDDDDDVAITGRRPPYRVPEPASRAEPPAPVAVAPPPAPRMPLPDATPIGAALLARSAPSKLPWMLVGTLGVAVLGLVAYIVMR
jgi:hypothetical protein